MLLIVDPPCGEAARQAVRQLAKSRSTLKPIKSCCTRGSVAAFILPSQRVPGLLELLARCSLVEFVEAACARRRLGGEPPVSYVLVGRVAIVSLDERLAGREREVAEEILRAVPGLRAVYGKLRTSGEFRVQELVHLAGESVDEVVHRENGLKFLVPLGRVYFNPRLATEHLRVAEMVGEGEIVLDMFSGVGGFALTISKLGRARLVVANDANPWAVAALVRSAEMNRRLLRSPLLALNMDAAQLPKVLWPVFDRVIMNLPHGATRFIPAARALCRPGCTAHVYVVASSEEDALSQVPGGFSASRAFDYAPKLYVYRVDAKLG